MKRGTPAVVKAILRRNRQFILRSKMRPCFDCDVQYNPWVMQFDHRVPEDKRFSLSDIKKASLATIRVEIEKCDVVCANCHAERTYQQGSTRGWRTNATKRLVPVTPDLQRELFS